MQETNCCSVEVTSIADDIEIKSIFRYRSWIVDQGIDYLVGIFTERNLPDGSYELVTLDGKHYSNVLQKAEVEDLIKRRKILDDIWSNSRRKNDRYWPSTFLRWGMENRDIAKISWYDDALNKGLLKEILAPRENPKQNDQPQKLANSEREKLLTIIAGMLHEKYNYGDQGIQKLLMRHIEGAGLSISENTLSKHFNDAKALLIQAKEQ
jgi:hypothetical protein